MSDKKIVSIGLLGFGNVGSAFFQLLESSSVQIQEMLGVKLAVSKVAVRDLTKYSGAAIDQSLIRDDPMSVITDESIDIVVECMGGIHPAGELIAKSLSNGKSVVTANKELMARSWNELHNVARKHEVRLFCEAAVGGAIPIIRALEVSLLGERIKRVTGILNGTTNYILTKMSEEGLDYHDALRQAQVLGFAESDPSADVKGHDAASKLAILASIAFHKEVRADDVFCEGIEKITASDIIFAKRSGYVIKLLAVAEILGDEAEAYEAAYEDGVQARVAHIIKDNKNKAPESGGKRIAVRVYPAMVPSSHPLASVRLSFNACFLEGEASGEMMLYGRGAGGLPTASAVLGDVLTAVSSKSPTLSQGGLKKAGIYSVDELVNKYYVSLDVSDQPGVLAEVAKVFALNKVSIRSMEQIGFHDEARLVFITHEAKEADMQRTLSGLKSLDCVERVESYIRVYGNG